MRKNFNDLKTLYENDIFAGIEPKETDSMLKCLNAKILSYKKGSALLLAGDEINWIGIVLSGVVHIIKEDYYGNRNIMAKSGAGQLFGEVFACAGTKSSPVSVFAAEDTEVMFLNCSKVLTVCSGSCPFHCRMVSNLLRIVSEKALYLNQKIDFLSKRTTREKLLAYLSAQAEQTCSRQLVIPFNRQELADFLCVDRSAMSAELGRMQRDGLIEYNKRNFRLL